MPLRRRRCTSGSCLVMCKERRKPTSLAQSDTHSDTQGKDWHSQHDSRNLRAAWIPMWTSTFIWMQQGSSKKSCHITFDVFLVEISWISSVEKQIVLQGVLHVGGVQVPLHLLGFLEASCNPATLATGCDKTTNTLVTHVTCRATHSQCLVFLAQSF